MGEREFGPYRLVRQIAVGGMAEIHLARAGGIAGFEKYVALKMIHPNFSSDEQFIQMLIDEAKISVQLQHANVAQTFDLGRVDETYYITMEYVDGADLYRLLRRASERNIQMPVDVAAYLLKEVATGLDYAHRKRDVAGTPLGIVHRDVSPQNVLISHSGEVKLVDFGIAKATMKARQTAVGVIKGKYYYMSPEQAWGENVDHRTDIFSAGILLYEMLVGQMLYLEEDLHRLLDLVRKANITSPAALRRDIPPQLERIVMHALQKEPGDRYQSAGDMATDLERFLHAYSPVFTAAKLADHFHLVLGRSSLLAEVEAQKQFSDGDTLNAAGNTLVRDRSELGDENSVIFNVNDLRRQGGGGVGERPAFVDNATMAISEADLMADAEERTVIDAGPRFDGVRASEYEPTLVGETWDDADLPDDEGPTLTREPGAVLNKRAPAPAQPGAPRGPKPLPGRPANPVIAAHTPKPAVSQLRPPRPSRKTPAGGVSQTSRSEGSLLAAIVSQGMVSEPVPVSGPGSPPAAAGGPGAPPPASGPQAPGPAPGSGGVSPPSPAHGPAGSQSAPGAPGAPPYAAGQNGSYAPPFASGPGAPQPPYGQEAQQGPYGQGGPGGQGPYGQGGPGGQGPYGQGGPGGQGPYGQGGPGGPQQLYGQAGPGGPQPYVGAPMAQPPAGASQLPGGMQHAVMGPAGFGLAGGPGAASGRAATSGNFPLQAPVMTPPSLSPLPSGMPGSFTRQLQALELEAIPDAYKIRRRPRWLMPVLLGGVCVIAGVTLGLALFSGGAVAPGVLVLESSPSGAIVKVDGVALADKTPTRMEGVAPGSSHKIEFGLAMHQPREQEAAIPAEGGEVKVFAFLKRMPVKLELSSKPPKAEVYINAERVGETPLQLPDLNPETAREVELRLKGYRTKKVPLDWSNRIELELTVPLEK